LICIFFVRKKFIRARRGHHSSTVPEKKSPFLLAHRSVGFIPFFFSEYAIDNICLDVEKKKGMNHYYLALRLINRKYYSFQRFLFLTFYRFFAQITSKNYAFSSADTMSLL
jgi:hypothetical protein